MDGQQRVLAIAILEAWTKKLEEKEGGFMLGKLKNVYFSMIQHTDSESHYLVSLNFIKDNKD